MKEKERPRLYANVQTCFIARNVPFSDTDKCRSHKRADHILTVNRCSCRKPTPGHFSSFQINTCVVQLKLKLAFKHNLVVGMVRGLIKYEYQRTNHQLCLTFFFRPVAFSWITGTSDSMKPSDGRGMSVRMDAIQHSERALLAHMFTVADENGSTSRMLRVWPTRHHAYINQNCGCHILERYDFHRHFAYSKARPGNRG